MTSTSEPMPLCRSTAHWTRHLVCASPRAGKLCVIDKNGDQVAEMAPGDFFGELSMLLDTVHRHTVSVAVVEVIESRLERKQ